MKPVGSRDEAVAQLEATLLRQLLQASGAFKGGEGAGTHLRADMFIETLADAVAKAGGLGLAGLIEKSLPADEASDLLGGLERGAPTAASTSYLDPDVSPSATLQASISGGRALNAYGKRAEDPTAGKPPSPKKGEAP